MTSRNWVSFCCLVVLATAGTARAAGVDLDAEPIQYSTAPADNPVARLQKRLDAGQATLPYQNKGGYLRALLRELGVPESSQMLVFSRTSLQRNCICPRTPRALYFNDEVYVGFCQRGQVLEITAADPGLGAVFYTLSQQPDRKPRFKRQSDDACLICHGSSSNQGFPGNLVRSVYPDSDGMPILASGSHRTDHTSPFRERWGGWYVTGTSGKQTHLGNLVLTSRRDPEEIDNTAGTNVTDLHGRIDLDPYLTPHSDLVALMVLEHQAEMHNRLTRATLQARLALHDEAALNKALGRPADHRSDSTLSRIRSAGEPVVQYLLFSGETALTEPVRGTSAFAKEFAERGPRDRRGRSLRELDLNRRLFRYPCSHLIYSPLFDGMPELMKDYVYRRLWEVLGGKDTGPKFAHLSAADRQAIREILTETKPEFARRSQRYAAAP